MHQEAISSVIRKYLWQALRLPPHLKVSKTSYFAQQTSLGALGRGSGLADRLSSVITSTAFFPPTIPQKNVPLILKSIFLSSITHCFQSYAVATCGAWWAPKALFTPCEAYGYPVMTHTHTHIQGEEEKYCLAKILEIDFFGSCGNSAQTQILEFKSTCQRKQERGVYVPCGMQRFLYRIATSYFLTVSYCPLPFVREKLTGGWKRPVTADILKGSSLWRVKGGFYLFSIQLVFNVSLWLSAF